MHGAPALSFEQGCCRVSGDWSLAALRPRLIWLRAQLSLQAGRVERWDLSGATRIDTFGALLLWRAWQSRLPAGLVIPEAHQAAFVRVQAAAGLRPPRVRRDWLEPVRRLGAKVISAACHSVDFAVMVGCLAGEMLALLRAPRDFPARECSAALYKTGAQALPIAALVGFLIGVVLSFLSAMQLRNFGAEAYLINILGIGIIRELGPVLVAILVAGRSGSAITAQLGVMRVTEEIDALAATGVSIHQRLVLPKVLALALAMPLLVLWTSAAALAGGMFSAHWTLEIDWRYFATTLPFVVPMPNLVIGAIKGSVFGVAIALIACHFGLRVKPNTESLSRNTTGAVVSAITAVILLDAALAVLTRGIGLPLR